MITLDKVDMENIQTILELVDQGLTSHKESHPYLNLARASLKETIIWMNHYNKINKGKDGENEKTTNSSTS